MATNGTNRQRLDDDDDNENSDSEFDMYGLVVVGQI